MNSVAEATLDRRSTIQPTQRTLQGWFRCPVADAGLIMLANDEAGHETRASVRNLAREGEVRAMLRHGGAGDVGKGLTLYRAGPDTDAGWADAVAGCDYVLHVASPFPSTMPKRRE